MSQQSKQDVITSASGYGSTTGISISWTLGETLVPTYSSTDIMLTHGFQQQIIVQPVRENQEFVVDITVYPNPASDVIKIVFDKPVEEEVQVCMFNTAGSIVKTDFIEPLMLEKQIGLEDLTGGIYILRLIRGNLINVYKVVKL